VMRNNILGKAITHLPAELDAALKWLSVLKVEYSPTRFARYRKILEHVEAARIEIETRRINLESPWVKDGSWYDAMRKLDAFATLFEVNELAMIHQGLAGKKLDGYLSPKLKELVSGPDSYVTESGARIKARNTGFELAVAARMATAGFLIEPHPGLADVVARLNKATYIAECKRPQSEAGVFDAIRSAGKQLKTRYAQVSEDAVGIIALDLTKVFNPQLLVEAEVSECEIGQAITNRMNAFLNRHRAEFERVGDARTAGILLRHSLLGWSKSSRRISWVHKYGIRPMPGGSVAGVGAVRLMERALEVALTL